MTKPFIFLLLLLPLCGLAQKNYLIKGDVTDLKPYSMVYLTTEFGESDSANIVDGRFTFIGTVKEPHLARLSVYEAKGLTAGIPAFPVKYREFYLSNNTIVLAGDSLLNSDVASDSLNSIFSKYWVEGQKLRNQALALSSDFMDKVRQGTLSDEDAVRHEERFHDFMRQSKAFDLAFLKNNPKSVFSLDLMEKQITPFNVLELEEFFTDLPASLAVWKRWQQVNDKIIRFKKVAIGSIAPDFALQDTLGNAVSLSSFRGKVVLLDFWASWCLPCRAENPHYLQVYNKFKNSGFDIIAVSLNKETEKALWLKAIQEDKISAWKHLSDLKGYKTPLYKLYEVSGLPQSYLIDQHGVIVGQNLQGDALAAKILEVL